MSDIKVRGPKGCAKTLSFDGQTYTAGKQSVFTVPYEAWDHLQRHGFSIDGQDESETETEEHRVAREAAEAEAATKAGSEQP